MENKEAFLDNLFAKGAMEEKDRTLGKHLKGCIYDFLKPQKQGIKIEGIIVDVKYDRQVDGNVYTIKKEDNTNAEINEFCVYEIS